MLMALQDSKDKFRFQLTNFCIMPTHIHLLIKPGEGTTLSSIMQWIKARSAKRWNSIHGSTDHVWGHRYYARPVKDPQEYDFVINYIDQNPVKAGLAPTPAEWKAGGAYYFICEYDGYDTMYGKVRFSIYPATTEYRTFSLASMVSNPFMKLDFSWET